MAFAEHNNEEWQQKLIGKTLVEDDVETTLGAEQVVRMNELPAGHRLLPPGRPQTRDYRPERLNVFVDENNLINQVYFG
ncbi:unnamed protein product [Mucor hiemalis]